MTAARIVIADDHRIFRSGLRSLLEAEPEFSVVGEASDGDEAEALVKKLAPDALLLDLTMPKRSGVEVLASLAETPGPTRTILLTAGVDTGEIIAALQKGARGVVLKASAIEQLLDGIRCVLAGQFWVEGTSVATLAAALELFRPSAVPAKNTFNLTPREIEIITALVGGASNRELAKQFSLSEDTVKHHLTNAFNKTGASTRLELALFALHHGIVRSTSSR